MPDDNPNQEIILKFELYQLIYRTLTSLFRWGGLAVIFYWIYRSVDAVTGQTTYADIDIAFNALANLRSSLALGAVAVLISLAFLGVWYGILQRNLRRKTVERLQKRVKELEKQMDPNRTSSELTTRGETRPEDE